MTVEHIIEAVNAYADAQAQHGSDREWLALTHRSSKGADADRARQLRDAGRDALAIILDWPTVERRNEGACVLAAPDGTQVLYYCERNHGRTIERLAML